MCPLKNIGVPVWAFALAQYPIGQPPGAAQTRQKQDNVGPECLAHARFRPHLGRLHDTETL